MEWYQTRRGFYYAYQKKGDGDPGIYHSDSAPYRHIAILANAVCLDRISIGFVPETDSKFIGPIRISRDNAFDGIVTTDYTRKTEPINHEWIRYFNKSSPAPTLADADVELKGFALFEDGGKFI